MTQSNPNPLPNKPNPQLVNFLETLKQKGSLESPQSASPYLERFNQQKEIQRRRVAEFHRHRSQEWQSVYSAKEEQVAKTIEKIRLELKKLAQEIGKFDTTINQAVSIPINKPGIYHQSFFDHIKQIITIIRQSVADSHSWLTLYRQKALKKGQYWQQANQGGSSFMLNNERQVATSVG
jgi:hypothetical protein